MIYCILCWQFVLVLLSLSTKPQFTCPPISRPPFPIHHSTIPPFASFPCLRPPPTSLPSHLTPPPASAPQFPAPSPSLLSSACAACRTYLNGKTQKQIADVFLKASYGSNASFPRLLPPPPSPASFPRLLPPPQFSMCCLQDVPEREDAEADCGRVPQGILRLQRLVQPAAQ